MPSGRMVSPDKMFNPRKLDEYYIFSKNGIKVFIEKGLIRETEEIEFLIISTAKYKIIKNGDKIKIV